MPLRRPETLEDQARYLSDLAQIRAPLARSSTLIDGRVPCAIAAGIFTADGVDDHGLYGAMFRGRGEIEAMYHRSNETTEASAHFIGDPVIDIDGDVAFGRTYVTGWTWTRESAGEGNVWPADWVFIGIYLDRFERTADGWLISERIVKPLGPGQLRPDGGPSLTPARSASDRRLPVTNQIRPEPKEPAGPLMTPNYASEFARPKPAETSTIQSPQVHDKISMTHSWRLSS